MTAPKDGGRLMTIGYDPGTAPEQLSKPTWPGFPTTSTEFITLIAHYYRAEIARMAGWRDRIDRTSSGIGSRPSSRLQNARIDWIS
jgi:uncharacterized membrane protein